MIRRLLDWLLGRRRRYLDEADLDRMSRHADNAMKRIAKEIDKEPRS